MLPTNFLERRRLGAPRFGNAFPNKTRKLLGGRGRGSQSVVGKGDDFKPLAERIIEVV